MSSDPAFVVCLEQFCSRVIDLLFLCLFAGLVTTTSRRLDREKQDEHILEVRASPRHLLNIEKRWRHFSVCPHQPLRKEKTNNTSVHYISNVDSGALKLLQWGKERQDVLWHFSLRLAESHRLPASQAHARKKEKNPLKKFLPVLISGWGGRVEGWGEGGAKVGGMWEILVTVPFVLSHCSVSWMEQAGTGNRHQLQQAGV